MNVLSALIEENPTKAQEFTIALSKIYRYVLDHKDKNLISIQEELNFAKLYVSLLKMRFEEVIIVNFELNEDNELIKIVPLSLQLLLENAVKHNIATDLQPLNIDVFLEDDFIVVRNSLQKKATLEPTNGIGLENIVQRYQLISNNNVEILQSKLHYLVKLPLISNEAERKFTFNKFELL